MTLPEDLRAVPPTTPLRVAWAIVRRDDPRPTVTLLWEGARAPSAPMWAEVAGAACVSEAYLRTLGYLHEGHILAFSAGVVLCAADDGRLYTLAPENLRVLPPEVPVA